MPHSNVEVVPIERVTYHSTRSFDDVVDAIYAGLGRVDDLDTLLRHWYSSRTREEFDSITAAVSGSSGLIEFFTIDLGAVLTIRVPSEHHRLLRIIAGNPVTTSKMTATVPDAGSYAPVTILVAERQDGVQISYDKISSAIAPHDSGEALAVARELDERVTTLLSSAADGQ